MDDVTKRNDSMGLTLILFSFCAYSTTPNMKGVIYMFNELKDKIAVHYSEKAKEYMKKADGCFDNGNHDEGFKYMDQAFTYLKKSVLFVSESDRNYLMNGINTIINDHKVEA